MDQQNASPFRAINVLLQVILLISMSKEITENKTSANLKNHQNFLQILLGWIFLTQTQSYPLDTKQLQLNPLLNYATFPNGYSTSSGGIIDCSAKRMATIFTRAKAAKKVIDLFDSQCGIPRSKLSCGARLESDLGVVGDDTYELLEAMLEDGVDMTDFDCHDRITPEGMPALPILGWLVLTVGLSWALISIVPSWPEWIGFPLAIMIATAASYWISRSLPGLRHEELRVRDLVLSVEAGHWKSPKAEQNGGGQPPIRPESSCIWEAIRTSYHLHR